MKYLQDSGPSVPISIVRSSAMDTEVTDHGSHAYDEQDEHDPNPNTSSEPSSANRLNKNSTNSNINNQNNSTWYSGFFKSDYPISMPQEDKSVDDTSSPVLPL